MIIDCIACLHGHYPKLEGGDLLIVAGDLTAQDLPTEYNVFADWIKNQPYKKRIVIGGNHDYWLQCAACTREKLVLIGEFEYLCDSGTEFEGFKIWGSPWIKRFEGMNPHCKAFTVDTEDELAEKWALIPDDIDILITHSPSLGSFDYIKNPYGRLCQSVGSPTLWLLMCTLIGKLKLHVCGHIHEAYGYAQHYNGIYLVNASHVNENYEPVNKPIRIEL